VGSICLELPCQHEGDVVWLLGGADPGVEGEQHLIGDDCERLVAVEGDDLRKARLAEFSKVVFRLGDAVGIGDQDVS
jgi:hypothetical protein